MPYSSTPYKKMAMKNGGHIKSAQMTGCLYSLDLTTGLDYKSDFLPLNSLLCPVIMPTYQ